MAAVEAGGGASPEYWVEGPAGSVLISSVSVWPGLKRANPWVKDPKVLTAFSQSLVCNFNVGGGAGVRKCCQGNQSRAWAARSQRSYKKD